MSASTIPTRVTRGRSRPLAIICVPMSTSARCEAKCSRRISCSPASSTASRSQSSVRTPGNKPLDLGFHLPRSHTQRADGLALAVRAAGWDPAPVTAMMANQHFAVGGEREAAARAFHRAAALPADNGGGRAAPVEEQDGLFLPVQAIRQRGKQRAAEHRAIPRAQFPAHVDDFHFRERRGRAGRERFRYAPGQAQHRHPPLAG